MKNQVQLITYVDRLGGGDIARLEQVLAGPLAGLFGGVHLLPFFHPIDGSDAGFDPIDHTLVDPRLGTWRDVHALAERFELMADLIVNHVSSDSAQFRDFLANGARSQYAGLFLTRDSVFPQGASDADLKAIFRPRPGSPFTAYQHADGRVSQLWTTFTAQQIDIDVAHPLGRAYLDNILDTFAQGGIHNLRLDAVGYAIKQPGTRCFMLPETFAFIGELAARARARGMEVLVEIHAYFRKQIEIARQVDRVYDFALPPLVLHAFEFGTGRLLAHWARIRPHNAVTVLDTHDGIGIVDVGPDAADPVAHPSLVPVAELDQLVERIHANSGGQSRQATGAAASNVDIYQVNCTYYDAMGRDDLRYLLARAIQFFLPGVPQVYYVGLLAGSNDMELLERTRVGRDINRHHYSVAEIETAVQRPVVGELLRLIRWRNAHPAFQGRFSLLEAPDESFCCHWQAGEHWATLRVRLTDASYEITHSDADGAAVQLRFALT